MPQTMSMWRGSGSGSEEPLTNNVSNYRNASPSTTNNYATAPLSQEPLGPSPPPTSTSASPPVVGSTPPASREGTSATRYEQQAGTHAAGQSAGPAAKLDGAGERHSIMDPSTVGQAPKEHTLPKSDEDAAPAPGLMETAQQYASVAYQQAAQLPSTVLAAVGMGGANGATREGVQHEGATQEAEPEVETKREYPEIDQLHGSAIEEFLRSQVVSTRKR